MGEEDCPVIFGEGGEGPVIVGDGPLPVVDGDAVTVGASPAYLLNEAADVVEGPGSGDVDQPAHLSMVARAPGTFASAAMWTTFGSISHTSFQPYSCEGHHCRMGHAFVPMRNPRGHE